MNNYTDLFIVFDTISKINIVSVFNHRCKFHKINEDDLVIKDNKICLPIILDEWKNIDDESDFENVLKALERITNPKGGTPLLVLKSYLIGYDVDKMEHFKYIATYKNGKHTVIKK